MANSVQVSESHPIQSFEYEYSFTNALLRHGMPESWGKKIAVTACAFMPALFADTALNAGRLGLNGAISFLNWRYPAPSVSAVAEDVVKNGAHYGSKAISLGAKGVCLCAKAIEVTAEVIDISAGMAAQGIIDFVQAERTQKFVTGVGQKISSLGRSILGIKEGQMPESSLAPSLASSEDTPPPFVLEGKSLSVKEMEDYIKEHRESRIGKEPSTFEEMEIYVRKRREEMQTQEARREGMRKNMLLGIPEGEEGEKRHEPPPVQLTAEEQRVFDQLEQQAEKEVGGPRKLCPEEEQEVALFEAMMEIDEFEQERERLRVALPSIEVLA